MNRSFKVWATTHYVLGGGSILFSIIVASHGTLMPDGRRQILSSIAAILAGCLTFFTPAANAKAYIEAWRHLDHAVREYRFNPEASLNMLNTAIDEGEKMIGSVVLNTNISQGNK